MVGYFKSRGEHVAECWTHARNHWPIAMAASLVTLYSIYTEWIQPNVEVPEFHLHKLPLSWALAAIFFALFLIVLEGSFRLNQQRKKEDISSAPLIHIDIGVAGWDEPALTVRVLRGGLVHRLLVHIPEIHGFKIKFDPIPVILENRQVEIYPSSLIYHEASFGKEDGKTLGGFLRAMESQLRKEGKFEKDVKCKIPMTVSFQDNNLNQFEQSYSIECGSLAKHSIILKEGILRKRI